ncbi:ATP-binding cassette domain-containing protein [Nocardioides sp. dk4132]|uniref:ABC transporter ATP-binding protein n=1 Tax=unclassified Nocardioides TaxID=2615069 RepID=UPI00129677B3|nr:MULTISPECIES: ABC transporter ATP-binding protein [unclassified Nocardioides]MQW77749.1 ATP-binding cassette domain-containing protein [Nocardioides sp. dk4132]QGA07063.1 ATP-binding cassette domain-containing protein [Nocardioides sp. dk884]
MTLTAHRSEETGTRDGAPVSLVARGVHLAYDQRTVVHGVDLAVPSGQVTVIVGANGCGKSTLLRGLGRILRPTAGTVELDGTDLQRLRPRDVAAVLGLLPQQPIAPEGITVSDLVARGRHPHQGAFRRWSSTDADAVAAALALTDTHELAGRRVEELSGGQRQRVWVAMMLAQDPRIMLLDEPTTYLDIAHQVDLLDLLAELNATRGTTVVMVLHDLNLAARYAHHLVVMADGRLLREGPPAEVLDVDCVRDAFGLESRVIADPVTGCPLVVPVGRYAAGAPTHPVPPTAPPAAPRPTP